MPSRETTIQRQARLRKAILALVKRQQLTEQELIEELEHIASPTRVKRQVSHLTGRSHITRVDLPDGRVVYEHWDLTMERVRALNTPKQTIRAPRRPGRIVA